MPRSRKAKLLLAAVTVGVLAPFLNKAFHIDDPLFIWMAQHIAKQPLDPYGFEVNWAFFPEPAYQQIQNPPLCSYYIAAVGSVAGWSEPALHVAFLLWAVLAVLGTFAVARRLCGAEMSLKRSRVPTQPVAGTDATRQGVLAALFVLLTPVFFLSATSVMCDVMLLALWLWAIEFWLRALTPNKWPWAIPSVLLITAATLTKYFGIALVPLLALYTLWRNWRQSARVLLLVLPILAIVAYDLWTKARYGRGLFSDAIGFAKDAAAVFKPAAAGQFFIGLSFLGGSLVAPVFCWRRRPVPLLISTLTAMLIVGVLCYFFVPINPLLHIGENTTPVRIEAAVFAAIGAVVLVRAVAVFLETRNADGVLLAAWAVGTFVFAAFLNWSITSRTFLPIAPVAAILIVRQHRLIWMLVPTALISLVLAVADLQLANSARAAANAAEARFRDQHITVWFQSHWGFQYYMQRWGARPFDARGTYFDSGDVIIVPANNTAVSAIPPGHVYPPEEQTFPVMPYVTTWGLETGAAFYSSIRGPIPWAIDQVQPEKYYIARFR